MHYRYAAKSNAGPSVSRAESVPDAGAEPERVPYSDANSIPVSFDFADATTHALTYAGPYTFGASEPESFTVTVAISFPKSESHARAHLRHVRGRSVSTRRPHRPAKGRRRTKRQGR